MAPTQTEDRPFGLRWLRVSGKGTDVWVGLHGFGGSRDVFQGLPVPPHVSLWATDLFGHGTVAVPPRFEAAAEALARSLGAHPPAYGIAYSMGARLALGAWQAHPALFRGLTLVGVHPGLRHDAERSLRRSVEQDRASDLRTQGPAAFFADWDRTALFGPHRRAPAGRERHQAEPLAQCLTRLGLGMQPDLTRFLAEQVSAGRAQVVVGAHDDKFRALLAPFRPVVVEGAHHDVLGDAPAALGRCVEAHWIRTVSSPSLDPTFD